MSLEDHIRRQIAAAMSPVNRYYASRHYGREVTDPETLLRYFIKHGGADDFGRNRGGGGQPNCGDGGDAPQQAG